MSPPWPTSSQYTQVNFIHNNNKDLSLHDSYSKKQNQRPRQKQQQHQLELNKGPPKRQRAKNKDKERQPARGFVNVTMQHRWTAGIGSWSSVLRSATQIEPPLRIPTERLQRQGTIESFHGRKNMRAHYILLPCLIFLAALPDNAVVPELM